MSEVEMMEVFEKAVESPDDEECAVNLAQLVSEAAKQLGFNGLERLSQFWIAIKTGEVIA